MGFKVELRRSQVSLKGESKKEALVHIGADGIGWIKTEDKKLDFNKVKGIPIASLSMRQWVENNVPYGVLVDGAKELDRQAELANSPAQRDALIRQAGQMRWSAHQSGRFGGGGQYHVEETSKESIVVLERMNRISLEQKVRIDINDRIAYLTALPAAIAASVILKDEPMSSTLKAGAMAGDLSEQLANNELRVSTTRHGNNISEVPLNDASTPFALAHLILDGINSESINAGIRKHNEQRVSPVMINNSEFGSLGI